MRKRFLLTLLMAFWGVARALQPDATRAEILQELGKPASEAVRGDREILIYPNNIRIELSGGRLVTARGIILNAGPPPAVPAASPPAAPPPAAAKQAQAAEDARIAEMEHQAAAKDATARQEMEKTITEMEQQQGKPPVVTKPKINPLRLGVELVLRWAFMLVVLKFAAKYWASEISWNGLAIAAATDALVRVLIHVFAVVALGIASLFYVDDGIATIVLIVVVKRVSYNHATGKAVEIALTAKVFTTVVGAVLFTVVLNFLF